MMSRLTIGVSIVVVVLCIGGPAAAQTDLSQRVDTAIEKGVAYLWGRQRSKGGWAEFGRGGGGYSDQKGGLNALVTYALLECGADPKEEAMAKALKHLAKTKVQTVYVRAVRAHVWHSANRGASGRYNKHIKQDVAALLKMGGQGRYSYNPTRTANGGWDNSNSHYGTLGVWAGADNGLKISKAYWRKVVDHWRLEQNGDGGWGYSDQRGRRFPGGEYYYSRKTQATMTAVGVATLLMCLDFLPSSAKQVRENKCELPRCIVDGLDWLDDNFKQTIQKPSYGTAAWYTYYYHGIERAGRAGGRKYFGGVDWHKVCAEDLLSSQQATGAWADRHASIAGRGFDMPSSETTLMNTGLALAFLAHGRQPVLLNKLQTTGDWDNRPRDLAALTRFIQQDSEQPSRWQMVPVGTDVAEWRDSHILYLTGQASMPITASASSANPHTPQALTKANIDKLRAYVQQGGVLFSITQTDGEAFGKSVRGLYKKLFPDRELTQCSPDHPIYTSRYRLKPGKVTFHVIADGERPLAIHTDDDLSMHWQMGSTRTQAWAFEAGQNVVAYVQQFAGEWREIDATDQVEAVDEIDGVDEVGGDTGGAAGAVNWIYIVTPEGLIVPAPGEFAGMKVADANGKMIQVPRPLDPGRVTVIAPGGVKINIPENLLDTQIPRPDGAGTFLARRPASDKTD
ncbi:hypothetical protein LCGC14_0162600 [marine sediment metagenome]|uniref:DUF4159 domain-containing protein n=1 Tax=marine sediment metagenome TaxID=412755 RepID=A0A0F9UZ33_9ZZZZ